MSNKRSPHDVVEAYIWLKMWAEGREGKYGMTVNQERDCDGKEKNGINLGETILQTHLPLKKSAGVGSWNVYPPSVGRAY